MSVFEANTRSGMAADAVFAQLIEGYERFRRGEPAMHRYDADRLHHITTSQKAQAAIIACSDSRVAPEVIFDQPLGSLFVCRVPGNVASESSKWMLEIAVTDLQVPLVFVLGHSHCLAVKQVVDGLAGSGGMMRMQIAAAASRARSNMPEDIWLEAVKQNTLETIERLTTESQAVRQAISSGQTAIAAAVFHVVSGELEILLPVRA